MEATQQNIPCSKSPKRKSLIVLNITFFVAFGLLETFWKAIQELEYCSTLYNVLNNHNIGDNTLKKDSKVAVPWTPDRSKHQRQREKTALQNQRVWPQTMENDSMMGKPVPHHQLISLTVPKFESFQCKLSEMDN
jgi:hypothetical protein